MLNRPLPGATATSSGALPLLMFNAHLDTKSITPNLLKSSNRVKNSRSMLSASLKILLKTVIRDVKSKSQHLPLVALSQDWCEA